MKQNWEVSFEYHLNKYSELNPDEASLRTNLEFDKAKSCFYLDALGYKLCADFPAFKLTLAKTALPNPARHKQPSPLPDSENKQPSPPLASLLGFQMQVLVMRVLTAGVYAPLTGNFKAYRELPWGDVYDRNFSGRCIRRFAYSFGFKPEAFAKAAESLGGQKLGIGDAAYEFEFSGGIKCRFILWKPDDEFPPSAQILFSDNAVLMYNAEDLAVAGDIIISALKDVL